MNTLRYKLILNPVSGRGKGEESLHLIHKLMSENALEYDLVHTQRPWHAAELACQAALESFDVVVSIGGDGTANEVLNGLMLANEQSAALTSKIAMGVLCVGRGNDFAYGMNIPLDLTQGCIALAANHRRKIDIGRVLGGDYPQGRFFGNGVGIGFDAVVGFEALKMKRLSGFPSYIVAAIKTIFLYYHAPDVDIQLDNQSIRTRALMISTMNGRRMGGGFQMAPNAIQDDGLFDVCLARQVSRSRIFTLIPHFLRGTQSGQPEITTTQTRSIKVHAIAGSLPVHADGETICTSGSEISIEILPGQIEIVYQSGSYHGQSG